MPKLVVVVVVRNSFIKEYQSVSAGLQERVRVRVSSKWLTTA